MIRKDTAAYLTLPLLNTLGRCQIQRFKSSECSTTANTRKHSKMAKLETCCC